jgi:hypothetical protein
MALSDFTKQLDPTTKTVAANLITEINFMLKELRKLRAHISEHGATELFTQGKNQFVRQTPEFASYVQLVARYGSLHRQLVSLMPKGAIEQGDDLDAFLAELE